MKVIGNILKALAALAAIAGLVFVIVKYGDQIVAWVKKTFGKYFPCCCADETCAADCEEVTEEAAPAAEEDFENAE